MSKKKSVVTCTGCGSKVRTTADPKGYKCANCRDGNIKAKPAEAEAPKAEKVKKEKAPKLTDAERATLQSFNDQLEAMKPVFADLEKYNPGGYKRFELAGKFADRLQKKVALISAM